MTVRRYFTVALLIPYLGIAAGVAVSRFYWGYWLRPPCSDEIVGDVVAVERFSTYRWDGGGSSGHPALLEAAAKTNDVSGEDPLGRLPAALVNRSLYPASPDPVDPSLLTSTISALAAAEKLVAGSPQYPNTADLHGHLARATTRAGDTVLLVALTGGQASNDHYPYYEAALALGPANRLSIKRLHSYYWDLAGLEGAAHWLAGAATVLVALAAWLLFGASLLLVRRLRSAS